MSKVIFALALFSISAAASAVEVILVHHNQTAGSGTVSTLITDGSHIQGQPASTATFDWDGTTLTSTGLYSSVGSLGSSPFAPTILNDQVTDLSIDTSTTSATGTAYDCIEGTFLAGVGANGCGDYTLGGNFADDSTTVWTGLSVTQTIGGDDVAGTSGPRTISAFDLGTVELIRGASTTSPGTVFEIGNGIELGIPDTGGELMRFMVVGPELAVIPDTTGNSANEAAVAKPGSVKVEVRDGLTGATSAIREYHPDPFMPAGIIAVPDANGNNASEVAAMGVDDTDTIKVKVRDGATDAGIRNITYYSSGHEAIDLAAISDVSGNNAPEISVLVSRQSDSRIFVQSRDVLTGTNAIGANIAFLDQTFTPKGLAVLPDIDTDNSDELVVFATRNSDGRGLVEIRESDGASGKTRIWYLDTSFTPLAVAIGDDSDSNGVPEIAMLAERTSDGRIVIERRNASGAPATTRHWYFSAGWQVIDFAAVSDTTDGDALPEYAVLATRNDGKPAVEIRNAGNPKAAFRRFFMDENFTPLQVVDMGDTNTNGETNLGVLALRNSDDRIRLEIRDARGNSNTKSIWFSP